MNLLLPCESSGPKPSGGRTRTPLSRSLATLTRRALFTPARYMLTPRALYGAAPLTLRTVPSTSGLLSMCTDAKNDSLNALHAADCADTTVTLEYGAYMN